MVLLLLLLLLVLLLFNCLPFLGPNKRDESGQDVR